jgi:hypothetical protein
MSDLLNSASLVMIPSGYKEDVVYSAVPTDGSGDLSFTRASNGTRINSAGLVEVVPWNLLEYSEDFTNAVWAKYQTTLTSNNTTAPNGTTTADKFAPNGTLTASYFSISQAITSGATSQAHTAIVYAKAGGLGQMLFYLGSQIGIYFNLTNGQFISYYNGVQTITNYSSEAVGDGWYKYTISVSGSSGIIYHEVYGAKSGAFIGNYTTADDCFVWGAQLNIGSTAKPYFPTTDRLNVPRLTYQNGGGGCPSLLLEKQSTNLALWSEDFTQSVWSLVFLVRNATANTAISPDGTQNADTIADSITTAEFGAGQLITATANTPQTTSIFVKANGSNFAMLRFYGNDIQKYYCVVVNLSTGVITKTQAGSSTSSTSSSITNMGNGWYRITATATMNTTDYYLIVNLVPSATPTIGDFGNSSYTGTGSNSIYVWGAQFE